MSASLVSLKHWLTDSLDKALSSVTIHLMGLGNVEIHGGGYCPQVWTGSATQRFEFTGQTPMIYGYYMMDGPVRIYSELFYRPWRARQAGDAIVLTVEIAIMAKQKG